MKITISIETSIDATITVDDMTSHWYIYRDRLMGCWELHNTNQQCTDAPLYCLLDVGNSIEQIIPAMLHEVLRSISK